MALEHTVEELSNNKHWVDTYQQNKLLDRMSEEGWELVTVVYPVVEAAVVWFYFKREKKGDGKPVMA